ncbi:Choline dehydrogenase [Pseudoxanthobacter soli DSM 19599]|uniref:Choline dehydrogenase n=1 Tax=Pseudoxanthobacter soli DSM 19599 TaxID=1123029 RepID=A0A1M7ZN91_9HYPH|nr:GMC family oxidoreductase N-terminal domain-containing protein [Pseudoxanthobacter soli]SHO66341.1 Choline dehydrogenase [Pseudoxanthobacter soli DSM 19599]
MSGRASDAAGTADYIVVGGGSAGCALAARLSEDPDVRVLLLEAGPRDTNPYIHMPVGFSKMTSGRLTWGLRTAPQRHANNREILYAQARVLGGGGSINAEIFTRGVPSDYDAWVSEFGCDGWSFDDLLPLFLRMEDNDTLSGHWHGIGGPLGVSTMAAHPLTRAFVQACQQIGMPYNPDFNGPRQEGTGPYQTTIRNGRRCSAAVGYLGPAAGRRNLTVRTGVQVNRVVVERGIATGVEIVEHGRAVVLRAEREVIVTSGAIGSPKLLLLSGIGSADELKAAGVSAVHDLPGVGRNLHDHFGIDLVYELNGPHSLDKYNKPHWMLWAGLEYALFRKGPVASNIVEGGAFWYADEAAPTPDLQFHFLIGAGVEAGVPKIPSGSGVTLNSYTLRPKARGSVRLASADPRAMPIVDPNFLGDPDDLRTSVEGVKMSREIMNQQAFARYIRKEHFPGDGVRTDADFAEYARSYGRTSYHPVGTCRMGVDSEAVVDPQLRVRGIERLRVCDSSVMPSLIGSNTNAPSIVIAEKASDLIAGNRARGRAASFTAVAAQ